MRSADGGFSALFLSGAVAAGAFLTSTPAATSSVRNGSLFFALVEAGGGPGNFRSTVLLEALAGSAAGDESSQLVKRFGAVAIEQFVDVCDFAVGDMVRLTGTRTKIASEEQAPTGGSALIDALYAAGVARQRRFDVDLMFDRLESRSVHAHLRKDIVVRYGAQAVEKFEQTVAQIVTDLHATRLTAEKR